MLNLIDTPGHVDFTYEVSRALAACEGALLVVDASQGIEAQTLANVYLALEHDLEIIPVINKIDLPGADPEKVKKEIEEVLGLDTSDRHHGLAPRPASAWRRSWRPWSTASRRPRATGGRPCARSIFDSYYDSYKGVIAYVRVIEGTVRKGDRIRFMATGKEFIVDELGVFRPGLTAGGGAGGRRGRLPGRRPSRR